MAVSSFGVDANPASSTITRLVSSMPVIQRLPLVGGECGEVVDEFVQGVGRHPGDRGAEFLGGAGLRRQPDDGAAAVAPGGGEDPHHGGLPGPGRGQRQLHPAAAGGDLPDHRGLPGVQHPATAVGRPFQLRQLHIRRPGPAARRSGRRR